MSLYKSKTWISDIDEILSNFPELKKLSGLSILITGATGLVCSAIVDILLRFNETNIGNEIGIIVAGRTEESFKRRFSKFVEKSYLKFIFFDAMQPYSLDIYCDYIIHGASNTLPNSYVNEAVETMSCNFIGTQKILEYAKETKVKKTLYISSSEIYGNMMQNQPYQEHEYGYIDILNPRSSYAISKRAAETLCASYSSEYNLETVIVRPGHIYGPTASPKDTRIAALWTRAVARGENIIMKSDGLQIRSYCYCLDCASAILKVLIDGKDCHAYNISNPNSIITIKEMAEILVKIGDVKLLFDFPTKEETSTFNPMKNSSLNSELLEKLGWNAMFNAERGFAHTVRILKEL